MPGVKQRRKTVIGLYISQLLTPFQDNYIHQNSKVQFPTIPISFAVTPYVLECQIERMSKSLLATISSLVT